MAVPSSIPNQNQLPPQFFVDNKKGEVNELRQLLKSIMNEKDQTKRRDVIKKVIAYMTLGIDVSRLFTDMVLISSTIDLVQKKMIYLYLINYAEANSDQALMAINTFIKDCKRTNPDAKIRGLALRSLCSLRFQGAFEYIQPAIEEGLADADPYVRKTAIIGLIKLYRAAKDVVKNSGFINTLYELIRDRDPAVSINSILALNEILEEEGGIAVNRKIVIYLLNRIQQYNEFGQSTVFDLVAKYQPSEDNELFDILNILEDRLRHSSSAVVLGCVKVFLNYTKDNPTLTQQVYARIQAPLLTLFLSGSVAGAYELSYTVLAHIHLIISRGAVEVFENEFKHFFCKYDEPTYIRILKIEILTLVCTENNVQEILNELAEYVTDVDVDLSRKAIRSIGQIGMKIPNAGSAIIQLQQSFLRLNIDHVLTETLIVMKDMMRKFRWQAPELLSFIEKCLEVVSDEDGKSAIIWMLGEFGEQIDDAPYILEALVQSYKEEQSVKVSHALLTACVKLFLKRAPEMQLVLANLFQSIFKDSDNADLLDRAGFYYKLLQANADSAYSIINSDKHAIATFVEDDKNQYIEQLCQEFNTLAVIYQKPSYKFVKRLVDGKIPESEPVPQPQEMVSSPQPETDLLSLDMGGMEFPSALALPEGELFRLEMNPSMETDEFQEYWMNIEEE
jgi:AP-4 complex subunit beta-1